MGYPQRHQDGAEARSMQRAAVQQAVSTAGRQGRQAAWELASFRHQGVVSNDATSRNPRFPYHQESTSHQVED